VTTGFTAAEAASSVVQDLVHVPAKMLADATSHFYENFEDRNFDADRRLGRQTVESTFAGAGEGAIFAGVAAGTMAAVAGAAVAPVAIPAASFGLMLGAAAGYVERNVRYFYGDFS
jgi:hypothetical protein